MKGTAWSWCPSTACRPSCSCSWRRASTATACDTPTPTAASTISNTRGCAARRTSCAAASSSDPRASPARRRPSARSWRSTPPPAASSRTSRWGRSAARPYLMRRRIILGPAGVPCTPPPFGALVAVNLATGGIQWNVPLGTFGGQPGSPQLGGPIVTAGGLVFIGATLDKGFRAFDVETGRELWKTDLPASARATPMTYDAGGRQFVVIAAGGSDVWGAGDAIIAFALPR